MLPKKTNIIYIHLFYNNLFFFTHENEINIKLKQLDLQTGSHKQSQADFNVIY